MRYRTLWHGFLVSLAALLLGHCTHVPEGVPRGTGAASAPSDALYTRVQNRTYLFTETNERMRYAVFVSSKVRRESPTPLIVALHGLGGGPTGLFGSDSLRLAEEGGYILVGPMGYNSSGWYGIPIGAPATRSAPATSGAAGGPVTDPARIRELSEKDVLNVLNLMRHEFSVDPRRTYLLGHSMGGAGALYLGAKYAGTWAAVAALAPANAGLGADGLAQLRDTPVLLLQGDADTQVSAAGTRRLAEQFKALNLPYTYKEFPAATHGSILVAGMRDVFEFFGGHSRP